ncbi:hypothetical protein C8T65DRAFT_742033 [Cerioporus squamosus]|nr:hypothetical protein C8T65DRAFT_742033 [Cerioporus squamosus]
MGKEKKLTKAQKKALRETEEKQRKEAKRLERKKAQMSGSGLQTVARTVRPGNTLAPDTLEHAPKTTSTATTKDTSPPRDPPPSSSPRSSPAPSPPPSSPPKRTADVADLEDDERGKRRAKLRKIIKAMRSDTDQRKTSKHLKKYKRKARMVPRLIHPFMDPYEALEFGRAYKGSETLLDDGDNSSDDDDDSDGSSDSSDDELESEDEDEDNDAREKRLREKKEQRAAERARKIELQYQYNALLKLIPNLKTDIALLDDDDIEVLAKYIKHQSGKARASDSAHLVDRVIQYIAVARGDMDSEPYPTAVDKSRRGFHEYVTARELVPPVLREPFKYTEAWKDLCNEILGNKVHVTAADYPTFLFDLQLSFENKDANILDGLMRGLLYLMAAKSLWTGPLSSKILGGRKLKTPGKPPIAISNKVSKITPRILAYTAVQLRHSMTAGSWNVMDLDFDNSDFFNRIVALFEEPMSDWAKELLDWWNMQVFGNMSKAHAKNLTRGRSTMDDMVQKALKERRDGKVKARGKAANLSPLPERVSSPPAKESGTSEPEDLESSDDAEMENNSPEYSKQKDDLAEDSAQKDGDSTSSGLGFD